MTKQTESEWDETGRARAEGLAQDRREVHSDGCGLHPAILAEPDVYRLTYAEDACDACASREVYLRILAERDYKWTEQHKKMPVRVKRPSDGRRVRLVPAADGG